MIKDVFTLKKNGWYIKLMKWMWNYDYESFSHICPLFWLTLLNLIILIPYCCIRLLRTIISYIIEYIIEKNSKKQIKKNAYNYKKRDEIIKILEENTDKTICEKYTKLYKEYKDNGYFICYEKRKYMDQIDLLVIEELYYKNYWAINIFNKDIVSVSTLKNIENAEELRKAKVIANKQKITALLKKVKPLMQLLLIIITVIGVYSLIKLSINIYKLSLNYEIDYSTIKTVLIAFLIVGFLFFIGLIISKLLDKINMIKCTKLCKFFNNIGKGIQKIWYIIKEIIKNNCPSVKWED